MRVVLWSDSDRFAGTERHCFDLQFGLRALGVNVRTACRPHSPLADLVSKDGGEILPLDARGASLAAVSRIASGLRSGEFDVVHAHNGKCTLLSCAAASLARAGRVVATQHFISPARVARTGVSSALSARMHAWIGSRVGLWLAVSRAVSSAMEHRKDAPVSRIRCVPNGIRKPPPSQFDKVAARALLGLPQVVPTILCVARLEREKAHAVLINAVAMVAQQYPDLHLILVGDGSEAASVRRKILELGIGSNVKMVGHQPDSGLWMTAADFLVLPSPAEPFGLVMLEAMSRRVPVIAAAGGGPLEVLEGGCGLLFNPGDARDMAAKIQGLIVDPDARLCVGDAGWKRWFECYQVETMSRLTLSAYADVLAHGWDAEVAA